MKKSLLIVLVLVLAVGFAFSNGFGEDYRAYSEKLAKADESSLAYWYEDSYARKHIICKFIIIEYC